MSEAPREFEEVLERWRPQPVVAQGDLCTWPAAALAGLLGVSAPGRGDALPPLWHELYLHPTTAVAELGEEGHPRESGLLPPLARRRRMFGGGRISIEEPLRLGEFVTRTSSVKDLRLREGRSGGLLLLTELHEFAVDGAARVVDERDIVYRLPEDVARTRRTSPPAAPVAPGSPVGSGGPGDPSPFRIDPDERLLFLFSALTYNAHRIHYDRRYTEDVEGHPDLLVHGPLLAIGAIEAARQVRVDPISEIAYRLVSPSHPGAPILFAAEDVDGPVTTVTGAQHGVPTVEAHLTWRDPGGRSS